jgi:hypothetical protein
VSSRPNQEVDRSRDTRSVSEKALMRSMNQPKTRLNIISSYQCPHCNFIRFARQNQDSKYFLKTISYPSGETCLPVPTPQRLP